MARFLVWTDLLDAGDVSTRGRHVADMALLWQQARVPVRMVRGNHELCHASIEKVVQDEQIELAHWRRAGVDIDVPDRTAEVIDGCRILGCTLWTDLGLTGGRDITWSLNDFRLIHYRGPDGTPRRLDPPRWLALHQADRAWLEGALAEPFEGPVLAMTHHMPAAELISPAYLTGSPAKISINGGFASDLWPVFRTARVDAWVFGHTHANRSCLLDGDHGPVPFIANARGYPDERNGFDPGFVLDSQAPSLPVPGGSPLPERTSDA